MKNIENELKHRILILDGAMGTMTQRYHLQENDFRPNFLAEHPVALKGNTDILNLTRPDVIQDIHLQYLRAGADIICTNTFGANAISQSDYEIPQLIYEMNYKGALLANEAIKVYQKDRPAHHKYVAGALGPTTKLASMSPNMNDPGYRSVNFDQLVDVYTEQAKALIGGGIDLFLIETITDTLNAKAALYALMHLFDEIKNHYPIMVSGTITDASGRILSGQTIEAFLISISHAPILSVGLNCALGAQELKPYMRILDKESPFYISIHPNAGLPNEFGAYNQSASEFASLVKDFAKNRWVNIVGGCCGTTPEHIKAVSRAVKFLLPRQALKNTRKNIQTNSKIKEAIERWVVERNTSDKPSFDIKEMMSMISQLEDEDTFLKMKGRFESERKLYHPEQRMLLNAHLFGKYQYLWAENRISRKVQRPY